MRLLGGVGLEEVLIGLRKRLMLMILGIDQLGYRVVRQRVDWLVKPAS